MPFIDLAYVRLSAFLASLGEWNRSVISRRIRLTKQLRFGFADRP